MTTAILNNRYYPATRLRRMRMSDFSRRLMAENNLTVNDLICPLFVTEGDAVSEAINGLPDNARLSIDLIVEEAQRCYALGIPAVILFPHIDDRLKDETGSIAADNDGLIPRTVRAIKAACPELGVITDVALDPYTSHGQDGVLNEKGDIDNDASVDMLIQQSLAHARAGADVIAPSDMMDGRIGAIREALEDEGFVNTKLLSYAAKYASHFYGPFRTAVGSGKRLGKSNKFTYQMDPSNVNEALHEVAMDLEEGADMVIIKPGLPYLDVVKTVKDTFKVPTFAYHVSGEYAMLKAAAEKGWVDEQACVIETMTAFKRAGADGILTYYARQLAEWLNA